MLSSTHYGVYDNNPWENCNPLCSSISPCYNAYDSWLEMMAMKDFQIWVLATGSLPNSPALDVSDEAVSSPSLPAFQHGRHSCSRTDSWEMWQPAPGWRFRSHLQSQPADICWGSRGNQGGCKELGGLAFHLGSSRAASPWTLKWSRLFPFPAWSATLLFIPTQEQGCLAEGAQQVKIWGYFQGFGWKIWRDWSLQSPSCSPWVRVTVRSSR